MIKITNHGQIRLSVEVVGKTLLFDPFVRQDELARHVDVEAVYAEPLLIAHGDFDHVTDAADLAGGAGAPVIFNSEVDHRLEKEGVKEIRDSDMFPSISGCRGTLTPTHRRVF